jgi:hypothetical protein
MYLLGRKLCSSVLLECLQFSHLCFVNSPGALFCKLSLVVRNLCKGLVWGLTPGRDKRPDRFEGPTQYPNPMDTGGLFSRYKLPCV